MDINELETYRLSDAVKFNDSLNPRLWGADERLRPEVRERLLAIADDFRESLGIDVEVKDITISGSNAAYTYTDHSDIDLHLVTDLPRADESDVYRELFDAKKYQYNDSHDFRIGGYDVELYVQDARQPHVSQGIYSVLDDKWIRVPSRRKPTVDDISVKSKYEDIGQRIDAAIESGDLERMDVMAAKIREMRQAGLAATGEFGPENLAFKILRGNGTLDRLRDARRRAKDQIMSLDERRKGSKKKKKTRYGFGGYYFPGYHYYGQTDAATDGGGDGGGGGGESVRESQESQQDIIERFTRSCADFLGMETMPKIKLRRDPQWTKINGTFGRYTADPDHRIELATHGRHIVDILRTLAHEITHARQNEVTGLPDDAGETGSKYEDSANAMAGRIMRHWAESEPHMFQGVELEEDLRGKLGAAAAAACIAGAPGCATTDITAADALRGVQAVGRAAQATKPYGTASRSDVIRAGAEEELRQELKNILRRGTGTGDQSRVREADEPLLKLDDPIVNWDIPYSAIARPERLHQARRFGQISHYSSPGSSAAVISVPVSKERAFVDVMRGLSIPVKKSEVYEASGYIPTEREKDDPRYKMALTVDVKPGQTGREANKLKLKTDSQGRPQLLMKHLANLLEEIKLDEKCWDGYRQQGQKKKGDRMVPNCVKVAEDDVAEAEQDQKIQWIQPDFDYEWHEVESQIKQDIDPDVKEFLQKNFPNKQAWMQAVRTGRAMVIPPSQNTQIRNAYHDAQAFNRDFASVPEKIKRANAEFEAGRVRMPIVIRTPKGPWLLAGNRRLSTANLIKKIPATVWMLGGQQSVAEGRITPQTIHDLADRVGVSWDDDPSFMRMTQRLTGERHLDDMDQDQLRRVYDHIQSQELDLAEDQEDLFEVKMSPGELRRWAESDEAEGIRAGFEAEMIFRDTSGGDSEDYEPDYDMDERARDIDEVLDFFRGGDGGISGGMANRLRQSLYDEYLEWREEAIANEWQGQVDERVRKWMETNVWGDDGTQDQYRKRAAEQLGIKAEDDLFGISLEQREEIEQQARELFNDDVDQSIEDEDRNYEDAREDFRDMVADSDDHDQSDWFRDQYPAMSDVADAFGIDWPYYTGGRQGDGSRSVEDIAQSLNYAIDMPVVGSSNYHGMARKPGRWIIEPDGSLDPDEPDSEQGLEIVSPPMPLPETLRKLQQVLDWANGNGDAYTNDSTGLHMGISIPYKGGAVDYVKLILFMGDQYVLDKFDRAANSYCVSALSKLRQSQTARREGVRENVQGWDQPASKMTGSEKTAAAMDLMRKNLIELAQQLVRDGVGSSKYTSAHMKDDYIEFRSPGGDYLSLNDREDQALEDTMLRFARAMYIAGRPDVERQEYSKKLYKLLSGFRSAETAKPGKDTRYKTKIETEGANDALELFAKYSSGRINSEELKKQWAEQVLSKEAPPPSRGKAKEYEVVRTDTGEVIDTIEDWNPDSAMETALVKWSGKGFDFSVREKPELEKPLSRRGQVAKKIRERPTVWHVEDANDRRVILIAANTAEEAKQKARQQDPEFKLLAAYDPDSFLVQPASTAEVKQYMVQRADNGKDSEQVQQRVQGTNGQQRYRVQWTERRSDGLTRDSLTVTARNADAAMDSIRSALTAQGRVVTSIEADLEGSTQDLQRQRAQQAQQPAGEFTGRWQIRDALSGEVLHTISGVALPDQGDANRYARQWIERTGYGGAYEIVPEMGS